MRNDYIDKINEKALQTSGKINDALIKTVNYSIQDFDVVAYQKHLLEYKSLL
jgi:hypothetical protein